MATAIFETNLHDYLKPTMVKKLGYKNLTNILPTDFWKEHALWEIKVYDDCKTIQKHIISHNLITDTGAISMLKNTYYSTGSQVPIFQYAALGQGTASTTLSAALSTGSPITSISVVGLPTGSSIASGQSIILTSGANTQTIVTSASAAAGATSLAIASFTPNFAYPIGTAVQPQPAYTDNPVSIQGGVYVANAAGAFAYTPTTGNGNRQVAFSTTFVGTSGNAGSYTEAWITNANPVTAVNQTSNHLVFTSSALTNGGSLALSFVEKL